MPLTICSYSIKNSFRAALRIPFIESSRSDRTHFTKIFEYSGDPTMIKMISHSKLGVNERPILEIRLDSVVNRLFFVLNHSKWCACLESLHCVIALDLAPFPLRFHGVQSKISLYIHTSSVAYWGEVNGTFN